MEKSITSILLAKSFFGKRSLVIPFAWINEDDQSSEFVKLSENIFREYADMRAFKNQDSNYNYVKSRVYPLYVRVKAKDYSAFLSKLKSYYKLSEKEGLFSDLYDVSEELKGLFKKTAYVTID